MPKLKNKLPKLCKMGKYAVVNYQRKKTVLGQWGTPEAKQAYARFITDLQNNPVPNVDVIRNTGEAFANSKTGLISELTARYLGYIILNHSLVGRF